MYFSLSGKIKIISIKDYRNNKKKSKSKREGSNYTSKEILKLIMVKVNKLTLVICKQKVMFYASIYLIIKLIIIFYFWMKRLDSGD